MRVCPLLGDLKFVDVTNGAEYFVETKKNHWNIIEDEKTGSSIWRHSQAAMGFHERPIFTWKAQWDFLYTTQKFQRKPQDWRAFLIPRDEIPIHWWNTPLQRNGPTWLDWPSKGVHSLDDYAVDLTADDLLVRDITKILETRRKARNPINMAQLHDWSSSEISTSLSDIDTHPEYTGNDVDDEPREVAWSSSDYRRGFGSFDHPQLRGSTYDVWTAAVVMEICRQK